MLVVDFLPQGCSGVWAVRLTELVSVPQVAVLFQAQIATRTPPRYVVHKLVWRDSLVQQSLQSFTPAFQERPV